MSVGIIACEVLKDEVEHISNKYGCPYPIVWVERGLHEYPDKLRAKLQEQIDALDGSYDDILLLYGCCGYGTVGLAAQKSRLVIPIVEDCVSMMLGGDKKRNIVADADKPLFMTRGWLEYFDECEEFRHCVEKYGYETTIDIYQEMFASYQYLDLIDTGAYSIDDCMVKANKWAERYQLQCKVIPSDIHMLENALTCNWQDGFNILAPGEKIIKTYDRVGKPGE